MLDDGGCARCSVDLPSCEPTQWWHKDPDRSAIGEQFVDLQPSTTSGPYLHDGSVIERFELPRPLEDVVSSALDFADSIPVEDLRTVVTELGNAFSGQGENLTRLVTSLSNLSRAGVDNISETVALLSNAESVLATQADQSDAILSWSRKLDLITAQLASSDPDVRRLLSTGTASASQLSALIDRHGGDMTAVVHDLGETLRTIAPTSYAVVPTFACSASCRRVVMPLRRETDRSISVWCSRPTIRPRAPEGTRARSA